MHQQGLKTKQNIKKPSLSLSDHNRIAQMELVFQSLTKESNTSINLIRVVTSAMIQQSIDNTSIRFSTKRGIAWSAQSQKKLRLIEWIMTTHHINVVIDEFLSRIEDNDMTQQMTTCFVLFELLQRARRRRSNKSHITRLNELISPLMELLQRHARVNTKPTVFMLAVMDALLIVTAEVSACVLEMPSAYSIDSCKVCLLPRNVNFL